MVTWLLTANKSSKYLYHEIGCEMIKNKEYNRQEIFIKYLLNIKY